MSGNTLTLLEPPEDDPVILLKSQACHVLSKILEVLLMPVCIWQGEGTSADEETISLDSGRHEVPCQFFWKYPDLFSP